MCSSEISLSLLMTYTSYRSQKSHNFVRFQGQYSIFHYIQLSPQMQLPYSLYQLLIMPEKSRHNTDVGLSLSPWCGNGFSPRLSLHCYSVRTAPHVQSHTSTSVCTLKIPNTGCHTIVAHTKILRTLIAMGNTVLATTLP